MTTIDGHASHRNGRSTDAGIHQSGLQIRQTLGLPCLGRDVGGLSQTPNQSITELKEALQVI